MDNKQALNHINEWLKDEYSLTEQDRESLNRALDALSLLIPKQPIRIGTAVSYNVKECPHCHKVVFNYEWTNDTKNMYHSRFQNWFNGCPKCGQRFTPITCVGEWESEALEQEPAYCDRNICLRNEYNGIGCEECEVTKSQEPCEDAVDREQVNDILGHCIHSQEDYYLAIKMLNDLPSVKQEPKTGHWVGLDEEPHEDYECDKCGYVVSTYTANIEPHTEYKFCPNCGAKMKSEEI